VCEGDKVTPTHTLLNGRMTTEDMLAYLGGVTHEQLYDFMEREDTDVVGLRDLFLPVDHIMQSTVPPVNTLSRGDTLLTAGGVVHRGPPRHTFCAILFISAIPSQCRWVYDGMSQYHIGSLELQIALEWGNGDVRARMKEELIRKMVIVWDTFGHGDDPINKEIRRLEKMVRELGAAGGGNEKEIARVRGLVRLCQEWLKDVVRHRQPELNGMPDRIAASKRQRKKTR
jgi:hypothetical protein